MNKPFVMYRFQNSGLLAFRRKKCFYLSEESVTGIEAAVQCAEMGGRLYSSVSHNFFDADNERWMGKNCNSIPTYEVL